MVNLNNINKIGFLPLSLATTPPKSRVIKVLGAVLGIVAFVLIYQRIDPTQANP